MLAALGAASVAVYVRWLALPMALPRYVDQPLLDVQKILGETPTAVEREAAEHDPKVEELREQELHREDL